MIFRATTTALLLLCPALVFGGQSLVLLPTSASLTAADPMYPARQPYRLELQLHNLVAPSAQGPKLFSLSSIGLIATVYPDGSINLSDYRDTSLSGGAPCRVLTNKSSDVLLRFQRDVANSRITCELWNVDGSGYNSQVQAITVANNQPGQGGSVGGGVAGDLGFLRITSTVLALGGRPPTTADHGDWTDWKFDGNLKDSSGKGHNLSGPARYVTTPDQGVYAIPKTFGAPFWSNWVSLRAGYPAQLDGTASYSMADASSAVSFYWDQVSGPSKVVWRSRDNATPVMTGLIFGDYVFSVKVVDMAGNTGSATLETGAVATDDNGVVINADPNVDAIFGPMIAFGKNPWGYADQRAMTATRLRLAAYQAQGWNNPVWEMPQPGTVRYVFVGGNGPNVGTIPSAITATSMSITVSDAAPLDLSSFPTRILVGPAYHRREDVRICGASALKGPATLTVCYDGRGQANPQGETYRTGAQAWPAKTPIWQMRIKGNQTNFLSTICPAGPGPAGPVLYNSGTVTLTAGSDVASAGGDANWKPPVAISPGGAILRVAATHGGGTPFVFYAYAMKLTDPLHVTLSRPYPSDADSGSFAYSIIQADNRYASLHYTRSTDGSDAQVFYYTAGCESATDLYAYVGHDINAVGSGVQTGKAYSYIDGVGYTSALGINFYGEDLGHRALYYRSGWTTALTAARMLGDHYVRSPGIAGGDAGGNPLMLGGGVIGGFASAILDGNHPGHTNWTDLRGFATLGSIGQVPCSADDTRDTSYEAAWLALAAGFDPDPAQKAKWNVRLSAVYNRELTCKQADNSWAHGFIWNPANGPLTVTKGSAVATGAGLSAGMCYGIASGQVTVANGSAVATPVGGKFTAGKKIVITATMQGKPYVSFFQFVINRDGSATMGALWPGDSGTFNYTVENNDWHTTIATSHTDPQLSKNWACTWNSPTQITLNRPWDGPTESNAYVSQYYISGFGQQPFMMGIKTTELKLASENSNPSVAAKFAALATSAATWIHDIGFDPVTQGMHYGRIYQACEPQTYPPPGSAFAARTPMCDEGLAPASIQASRVLTAETSQALRVFYESNPTPAAKAWGDTAYGSIWGNPPYTTGGVYSDPYYVTGENSDTSLGAYKWTGFFFGMGMAHQWPAVRLGGAAPLRLQKADVKLDQSAGPSARVTVTFPSGAIKTYTCDSAAPCTVELDRRQGAHWVRVDYLSASGQVLTQRDPQLLSADQ